ncbi:DUF551 domain-containing protein [Enterobacter hormaechei]
MTTITREQAQKIIDAADEVITALAGTNEDIHPDNYTKMCEAWNFLNDNAAPPEVVRELARITQTSLTAEPVAISDDMAYAFHHAISDSPLGADEVEEIKGGLRAAFANVIAPQALVSVPDNVSGPLAHAYKELTPTFMRNHIDVFERYGIYPDGSAGIQAMRIALDSMNRRAAMLQGADPVTTANKFPFEQWLSQQTGTIDVECGCVMTEVFFHWLRVAYEAGNSPVIPDGWVLVPVEPTMSQEFAGYRTLTDTGKMSRLMKTRLSNIYRAMIATAPQQEVK